MRKRETENTTKTVTLQDIADELGLSKSTVSRVLSGSGRISSETRQKVMECAENNGYKPNLLAKGLATSRSFNIGVLLPDDGAQSDIPFFHKCLAGITQEAAASGYDVLVIVSGSNNSDHLERVLNQNKADGVIITRLMENDTRIKLLKETSMPFIVIGSDSDRHVCHVDTDNEEACRKFTVKLIDRGCRRFLYLGGPSDITVNRARTRGFMRAMEETAVDGITWLSCLENRDVFDIEKNLMEASSLIPDCIICGDDVICSHTMNWLDKAELRVPEDVQVASFYNSSLLERYGTVHAIDVDAAKVGKAAAGCLLRLMSGDRVEERNWVSYSMIFRDPPID